MAALFLLLAIAAALGVVVGLLLVASAGTTKTRRTHRVRLRTAGRDLNRHVAELERENARLQDELARRDQRVRHPGEFASPHELESTASAASTAERRVTVPPHQLAERPSEPSTKRPNGLPGSGATRTCSSCPPMTGHALGRPASTRACPRRHDRSWNGQRAQGRLRTHHPPWVGDPPTRGCRP